MPGSGNCNSGSRVSDIEYVRYPKNMVIMYSYADVIEMKRMSVFFRSRGASPAYKCERETSSMLSSYFCFSPRFKGGKNGPGTFRHQLFGRQYGVNHMGDKIVDQKG